MAASHTFVIRNGFNRSTLGYVENPANSSVYRYAYHYQQKHHFHTLIFNNSNTGIRYMAEHYK